MSNEASIFVEKGSTIWGIAACKVPKWRDLVAVVFANRAHVYSIKNRKDFRLIAKYVDKPANFPHRGDPDPKWTDLYAVVFASTPKEDCLLLAVAGRAGIIKVIDLHHSRPYRALIGHGAEIDSLRRHPHLGHVILSSSADYTARVWDVVTGQCLAVIGCGHFAHAAPLIDADFSLDGKQVCTAGHDSRIKVEVVIEPIESSCPAVPAIPTTTAPLATAPLPRSRELYSLLWERDDSPELTVQRYRDRLGIDRFRSRAEAEAEAEAEAHATRRRRARVVRTQDHTAASELGPLTDDDPAGVWGWVDTDAGLREWRCKGWCPQTGLLTGPGLHRPMPPNALRTYSMPLYDFVGDPGLPVDSVRPFGPNTWLTKSGAGDAYIWRVSPVEAPAIKGCPNSASVLCCLKCSSGQPTDFWRGMAVGPYAVAIGTFDGTVLVFSRDTILKDRRYRSERYPTENIQCPRRVQTVNAIDWALGSVTYVSDT
ncbi:putative polycomb protein EED [Paratrimastix pyriformis]|uniref:Polycomb protein EED n=1 Tax=Paratrimastix pyriformis TaxID=342808 RepID=A0ABQ8UAE0_9EUKA|nr:putative polycomb protein EED [Paratrimastix pyriformis]